MTLDYPRIRANTVCPLCAKHKLEHTLVCWPCFRTHNLRQGESVQVATILETVEQRLIEQGL
jgi:ribosomal protein L37AE/L43A